MNAERIDVWEHWNEQGGPKYPHDQLVRFCFRSFTAERRAGLRALDLGSGSGVHTLFLAREGCRVVAVDLSPTGVENTRRKLAAEGLVADVRVGSADALELPAGSLDLVVSVGVLDSAGVAVAREAVRRAVAALAVGGRGFFLFASDSDYRVRGPNEYGLHGFSRAEVNDVFSVSVAQRDVDRCVVTYGGGATEQNDWIVTLTK
jgi:SAM-dependent methyltransferase